MANLGFKAGFLKHLYISYISVCPWAFFLFLSSSVSQQMAALPGLLGQFSLRGEMLLYIGGDALWLAWHHSGALFLPQEDPTGG